MGTLKIKMFAPNQLWFKSETEIVFQSYETTICSITNFENGNEPIIKITEGQPQSKTTAKYLIEQILELI